MNPIASLISIITPAYNAENTINKTIQSVINQTYQNWELIIVDDGSNDNTNYLISKYTKKDSRIKLISQLNSGPAIARQTGLNKSKGRFIAFLDSDDTWLPNKLKLQIEFMISKEAILSYTAFRRVQPSTNKMGRKINVPIKLNYEQLLGNTAIATSTVMVDKIKSGKLKMRKCHCDDFVLWLSILKKGKVAYGLNKDLVRYSVLSNSWSRNKWKNAKEVWYTYRKIEHLELFFSLRCFMKYAMNAFFKYKAF